MLSTPHLLVGAALVKTIPNPLISLPAAFASHFLLDTIPHWDGSPRPPLKANFYFWEGLDYSVGVLLVWWFSRSNPQQALILFGAFLGTAPDFMMWSFRNITFLPWNKWSWYTKFNQFHRNIQRNISPASGFVTAMITIGISIYLITKI